MLSIVRNLLIGVVLLFLCIEANKFVARVLQSHFRVECAFDTAILNRTRSLPCFLADVCETIVYVLTQRAPYFLILIATCGETLYETVRHFALKLLS